MKFELEDFINRTSDNSSYVPKEVFLLVLIDLINLNKKIEELRDATTNLE